MNRFIVATLIIAMNAVPYMGLVPHAEAVVAQMSGAEQGTVSVANTTAGTVSVSTSVVKHGTYSFRTNPTTTGTGHFEFRAPQATGSRGGDFTTSNATTSFWFYINTLPTTGKEIFHNTLNTSNATIHVLYVNPDGTVTVRGAASTAWIATTTTALSTGVWYHISMGSTAGTSGFYELKINDVTELSGTGNFGSASNYRYARIGKSTNTSGNTVDFFYDTIVVANRANDTTFYNDEIRVMMPDATGTYTDWTGDWDLVDERPPDGSTTYVSTGTTGAKVTFNASSTATVGITGAIRAIKTQVAVSEAAANNDTIFQTLVRSGSVDATTTNQTALSNSYVHQEMLFATSTQTGSAWTTSELDSIEVGGINVFSSTTSFRITQASVEALFTPSVGGALPFNAGTFYFNDDE